MSEIQKIRTCLWFNHNAEEAIEFYTSVFRNSKLINVLRNGDDGPGPKGSVLCATFQIEGRQFDIINGGPMFQLSEAVSLVVDCADQAEVDHYWKTLSAGGAESHCGWLKDRFGLSWQVVPRVLYELLASGDAAKAARVTKALMAMGRIDVAALLAAAEAR